MILLVAVALAILVALLRGGKMSDLATVRFRYGWVALLALLLQFGVVYLPPSSHDGFWGPRAWVLVGSYGMLVFVIIVNRRIPGVPIIGLGLIFNYAVIFANGGYMPVSPDALERAGLAHLATGDEVGARVAAAKDVLLHREQTALWVLSDIFSLPPPIRTVFSIGDVFLAVGAFWFFLGTMRPKKPCAEFGRDPSSKQVV
ncbi:MAG TPA: DUF5317 domain-containing protein [Chloroflexi bacterium]|jgi:hypothetical protein|nr:DUF5317 domain-containing protein [Chloroflexota bacterium]